ncbi:MAG: hypothetical protein RIR26_2445 [Pseudomonadota bacterium]|jgi:C4-dicarboxylate-specific signal transduction histidine kinase
MNVLTHITGNELLLASVSLCFFILLSKSERIREWADVVCCALLGAFAHALMLQSSGMSSDDWQLLSAMVMVLSFSFMRWVLTRNPEVSFFQTHEERESEEQGAQEGLNEQQLHQERLKILGTFSARLVHEINQPAGVILLRLQELKRADAVGDRQAVQKCFTSLENQLNHLIQLSQSVRTFASSSEDRDWGFVKIAEVIHLVRDMSETWAAESGVTVTWPQTIPQIEIAGDRTLHTQVLLNLIKNAVDAVAGLPSTQQRWIRLEIAEKGGRAEFSVSNGGAPLTRRVQSNLFRPFFTSKRTGRGLGLGLTICRQLVESVGGDIWYDESAHHPRFVARFSFLPSVAENSEESGSQGTGTVPSLRGVA